MNIDDKKRKSRLTHHSNHLIYKYTGMFTKLHCFKLGQLTHIREGLDAGLDVRLLQRTDPGAVTDSDGGLQQAYECALMGLKQNYRQKDEPCDG